MDKEAKRRESPFVLRVADMGDLQGCTDIALLIPTENDPLLFPKPSVEKVTSFLTKLIEQKTLIIYENNGVIVGILGITIDSFWWTDEKYIMDALFFVKPEFRSHNTYRRMLSAVEAFAKINNLPVALLFFTTKDVKRKFKLLSKRGYKSAGFWVVNDKF